MCGKRIARKVTFLFKIDFFQVTVPIFISVHIIRPNNTYSGFDVSRKKILRRRAIGSLRVRQILYVIFIVEREARDSRGAAVPTRVSREVALVLNS